MNCWSEIEIIFSQSVHFWSRLKNFEILTYKELFYFKKSNFGLVKHDKKKFEKILWIYTQKDKNTEGCQNSNIYLTIFSLLYCSGLCGCLDIHSEMYGMHFSKVLHNWHQWLFFLGPNMCTDILSNFWTEHVSYLCLQMTRTGLSGFIHWCFNLVPPLQTQSRPSGPTFVDKRLF